MLCLAVYELLHPWSPTQPCSKLATMQQLDCRKLPFPATVPHAKTFQLLICRLQSSLRSSWVCMTFVSTSFIERGEMLSCRSSIEIIFLFLTVPDYPPCLIYSGYRYAPIKPFRPYRDVVCYRLLTHGSMEVNVVRALGSSAQERCPCQTDTNTTGLFNFKGYHSEWVDPSLL